MTALPRPALAIALIALLALAGYLAYDFVYRRPLRREAARRFTINRVAVDQNQLLHESFVDHPPA